MIFFKQRNPMRGGGKKPGVAKQRIKLLGNPTMREAKGMEKMDPLSTCIICGIRVMQREKELPAIMNTMKLEALARVFGVNP